MSLDSKLKRWSDNNLISSAQAKDILAFEKRRLRFVGPWGLGGLGVLCIILGVASFVAANWESIPPEAKIGGHVTINLLLALLTARFFPSPGPVRDVSVGIQAGLIMTLIALVGQILQTQAPMWQAAAAWLVLATPMLVAFTRWRGFIVIWFGALALASGGFAVDVLTLPQAKIFVCALPFLLYGVFSSQRFVTARPVWTQVTDVLLLALCLGATSFAQFFWHAPFIDGFDRPFFSSEVFVTLGAGVVAVVAINVAQRASLLSFWRTLAVEWDVLLIVSYLLFLAPMVLPHTESRLLGVVVFCLYWLFVGVTALRLGKESLWSLAIALIGLRVFMVYVEIMGSLAAQGVGFILSGCLLLFGSYLVRKLIKSPPRWLIAKTEGNRA